MNERILDNEQDSDYCTCGHAKKDHAHIKYAEKMNQFKDPTDECYAVMCAGSLCECLQFKLDNFAYVKKIQEQRDLQKYGNV